jgi:competence protein ComEC
MPSPRIARAAVVISPREAPGDCAATLVDRKVWRNDGAVSLRWTGAGFAVNAARPPGYARPWARGAPVALQPALRPAAPDATPRTISSPATEFAKFRHIDALGAS